MEGTANTIRPTTTQIGVFAEITQGIDVTTSVERPQITHGAHFKMLFGEWATAERSLRNDATAQRHNDATTEDTSWIYACVATNERTEGGRELSNVTGPDCSTDRNYLI